MTRDKSPSLTRNLVVLHINHEAGGIKVTAWRTSSSAVGGVAGNPCPDRASFWVLGGQERSKRRAGIGPRRVAQAKTLQSLARPRIWLTELIVSGLLISAVFGMTAVQETWFDRPVSPLLTGFLLGAGLASSAWGTWISVVSVDGSVNWRTGAVAEQWTANELHQLGASWQIEHDVPFPEDGYWLDVDHIAIGPHGVLAVETKWTSDSADLTANRLSKQVQKALGQAEANAGRVRGLLRRVSDIDVIPLVVYWGPGVTPPTTPVRREGKVRIVAGSQAALWRPLLQAERLEPEMVAQLSARVQSWLVEQEQKTISVDVGRRLRPARRLGQASVATMVVLLALLPATMAWDNLDRLIGPLFGFGGGAVGVVIFLLPLVLALATLGLVYVARRQDPSLPFSKGIAPLVMWCTCFGALWLFAS